MKDKKLFCTRGNFLLLCFRLAARVRIDLGQECVCEQVNIAIAFPKWRKTKNPHGQAVEQIFSEAARGDIRRQVTVCRGDDTHINLDCF